MPLTAILLFGICTLWVPARWALATFQVALLTLAATRVAMRLRTSRPLGRAPIALLLAAAVAWCLIQFAGQWTVDPERTLEAALAWAINLAAFGLALDFYGDRRDRERFLQTVLIFTGALAVVGIFTALTSPPGRAFWTFDVGTDQLTVGPFVYKNQFAAFVEAVLPVAIFGAIRDRKHWLPYTATAALLFGSVVAGGSRAGAILCVAEIVLVPLAARARHLASGRTVARVLVGSLAALAALTAVVGWQGLLRRFEEPNPYSLRAQLVESSLAMLHDRPLTGSGLGTWSTAYPGYALFDDGRFVNQAHNDWVQWLAEGGFPFLLLVLAIAACAIRPALRTVWGIGLLAVFLHCLVDYPMQQRPALAAFFFSWMGVLIAGDIVRDSKSPVDNRVSQSGVLK